jgi:hypothetical protein
MRVCDHRVLGTIWDGQGAGDNQMNVLPGLLQENTLVLSEAAAVADGPSAEWLADRLGFHDLYDQAISVPYFQDLFGIARTPTYLVSRWEEEQFGLQAVQGLSSWVEFIQAPNSDLGLVLPNDSGSGRRISMLTSVGNGMIPVWATFAVAGEQRIVTAVGVDSWHCLWKDGGCASPSRCGGVCDLTSVSGQVPGARRCLCDRHRA